MLWRVFVLSLISDLWAEADIRDSDRVSASQCYARAPDEHICAPHFSSWHRLASISLLLVRVFFRSSRFLSQFCLLEREGRRLHHGWETVLVRAAVVRAALLRRGAGVFRSLLHCQRSFLRPLQLVVHSGRCLSAGHRLRCLPRLRGVCDDGTERDSRGRAVRDEPLVLVRTSGDGLHVVY